ncbi:unnamed protein product [Leptidea sinapis]|uniref:Uncharacterized protein n=1 Tax=Leptidea sinapis TaxID=189913 RepID=A0A5E4QWX8_9NEOP|nr:unnamed protein product [Leptidea sinapis]
MALNKGWRFGAFIGCFRPFSKTLEKALGKKISNLAFLSAENVNLCNVPSSQTTTALQSSASEHTARAAGPAAAHRRAQAPRAAHTCSVPLSDTQLTSDPAQLKLMLQRHATTAH